MMLNLKNPAHQKVFLHKKGGQPGSVAVGARKRRLRHVKYEAICTSTVQPNTSKLAQEKDRFSTEALRLSSETLRPLHDELVCHTGTRTTRARILSSLVERE